MPTSRDPKSRQDEGGHHVDQLDSSGCALMEHSRAPWFSRQRRDLAVNHRHGVRDGGTRGDEVCDHENSPMGRHTGHLCPGTNVVHILMSPRIISDSLPLTTPMHRRSLPLANPSRFLSPRHMGWVLEPTVPVQISRMWFKRCVLPSTRNQPHGATALIPSCRPCTLVSSSTSSPWV